MPERVAPGLRPDREAVRAGAYVDPAQQAPGAGRDRVDLAVPASAEPQHPAAGRHAAHVRAAASRDPPARNETVCAQVQDGDRALAAVGDEQPPGVTTQDEAVGAGAGLQEPRLVHRAGVDPPDAAVGHVGDVEPAPVGTESHVLGHRAAAQLDVAHDPLAGDVEDGEPARELA